MMFISTFKIKFLTIANKFSFSKLTLCTCFLLGSFFFFPLSPSLLNAKEAKVESIYLPKDFHFPNGITHAPDGTIYVGSVTKGDIISISPDGDIKTVFKETKDAFAGTSLRFDPITNILWAASPDFVGKEVNGRIVRRKNRIVAIDISKGNVIWSASMPNKGFGNDFALDGKGGIYITDSTQDVVLHLAAPGAGFKIIASSELMKPGDLGPAGIAQLPNGNLVIGLWRDGALLYVKLNGSKGAEVTRLRFERDIENPDGLAVSTDGRLLILEGGVKSGNGKLLAADLNQKQPFKLEVLLDKLDTPLNLTVNNDDVYITEGRVRHFIIKDDPSIKVPNLFRVIKFSMIKKSTRLEENKN